MLEALKAPKVLMALKALKAPKVLMALKALRALKVVKALKAQEPKARRRLWSHFFERKKWKETSL